MAKKTNTNVARLLEQAGIAHTLAEYPVDEEHLDAVHVAQAVGQDIADVYKTIILHGARTGHFACVVRGDAEIDLKKAARAAGDKSAQLIHVKELLPLTGYVRGGCSPIGMKKNLRTFFDTDITGRQKVYVSAGRRGTQVCLAPADLIAFTGGTVADLITR